jgi:hypothetical protein
VALIAEYFYTGFDGNEQPRGGQARTTYWSYDFAVSLYAEEGNTISIPAEGDSAGEGFLIPTFFNIGGPQSITVQVDLGSIRKMLPYPYDQRGFELNENNLYGSTIGAIRGTIDVEGGGGLEDVTVDRSVWGDRITQGALEPRQLVVTFTNEAEEQISRTINVAWDSYAVFISGGEQTTISRDFSADPPGIRLISFPLQPLTQDAAELLGVDPERLLMARWDPQAPADNKYTIYPRIEPIKPGLGYFIRIFSDISVELTGVLEPEDDPFVTPMSVGWNSVGSPRRDAVDVSSLQFEAGGEAPVNYEEAVAQRIIQEGVFGYTPGEGYTERDRMVAFDGYWIRCMRADGALLRFPPVDQQTAARPAAAGDGGGNSDLEWEFPVVAEAAAMRGSAWIAAAADANTGADAHDMQAPPGFGPGVRVELAPDSGGAGRYRDVRPAGAGTQTWNLRVRSDVPETAVRVTWPDLSELPDEIRPVLVDEAAGRRACMRTTASYELPAGPEGLERDLKIECRPRSSRAVMVSGMSAMQAGSSAAQVVFSLSAAADVDLDVLNIAGRAVRNISMGQRPAGRTTMSWNLRDRSGTLVPSGLYLVRLQARDADGRQSRALRTLQIVR